MVNLNTSLLTGFSGVQVAQVGLNVTGNNIANVNTEGYSRQSADHTTRGVLTSQGITVGIGADVREIMAARENLANQLLTNQKGRTSLLEEHASGLNDVESLMAESDETGIAKSLNELFSAVELSVARPSDLGTREQLLITAEDVASEIRARDADLDDLQRQSNTDIADLVSKVNLITERIADINRNINSTSTPSQNLIDDRQREINELSKLVGVDVFDLPGEQVQVNIQGANQILVGREMRNTLSVSTSATTGFFDVNINVKGTVSNITSQITSGKIGGKLQVRDTEIPQVRERLDNLAAGLIISFNTIHQTGFGLNGTTGLNFFDPPNATVLGATAIGTQDPNRYDGIAGTITLSNDLVDPLNPAAGFDATRLAHSSAAGAAGNNAVVLQLADLRNSTAVIDSDRDGDPAPDAAGTFERYHSSTLSMLGRKVNTVNTEFDTQQALLEQAEARVDQVSGVSLDEEAISLSQYQRAFEASSRFLGVINQLTSEIINRLGS